MDEGLESQINSIAKVAGVSIGSLYQYFKNKEDVIHSLYKHLNKRTDSIMEETGKIDISKEEKIQTGVDNLVEHFIKYGKHFRFFFRTISKLDAYGVITRSRRKTALKVKFFLINEYQYEEHEAHCMSYIIVNASIGCIHNYLLEGEDHSITKRELKDHLAKCIIKMINTKSE